jgi:anti-sigma B factor antagonist
MWPLRVPERARANTVPDMEFAPPTFECTVEVRGDTAVVIPQGELDLASSGRFETAVRSAAAGGKPSLTIDLGELEFCDSTGLHTIVTLVRELSQATQVTVVPGRPPVHRIFMVAGLQDTLPFVTPA